MELPLKYILVLVSILFSSNYLDLELSKYGIDWASDENLKNLKRGINNEVQKEISSILHPDKFMISVGLGEALYFVLDSTHIKTKTDEQYHNEIIIIIFKSQLIT